jgi:hypothetical protein
MAPIGPGVGDRGILKDLHVSAEAIEPCGDLAASEGIQTTSN